MGSWCSMSSSGAPSLCGGRERGREEGREGGREGELHVKVSVPYQWFKLVFHPHPTKKELISLPNLRHANHYREEDVCQDGS